MTYNMILANQQEGVAVLQCLQDTFPVYNTSLNQWVAHVLKQDSLDSDNESSGSEDMSQPTRRQWSFTKSHGMAAHVWSTPLMYGDMQNVSAQIIENMHLRVARSNGQDGWELQAMVRNMREGALQLKKWTPPHSRKVTGHSRKRCTFSTEKLRACCRPTETGDGPSDTSIAADASHCTGVFLACA